MRRAAVLLAVALLVPLPTAAPTETEVPVAGAGPLPTGDLVTGAKALDRGNATAAEAQVQKARDRFEERFAPYSPADPTAVRGELDRLANETDPAAFRTKIHRFEVALLELTAANVDRLLDDDRHGRAIEWLRVGRRMADGPGRKLPYDRAIDPLRDGRAPAPVHVATALDATAAFRMLEAVQSADDLEAVRDPAWRVHADRAAVWWEVVEPRARDRLPDAAFEALEANVSTIETGLASRDEPGPLPGVRGPLTSLAYHRSIERLDEVGAGVEAGITAVHRTVRRDPRAARARTDAFLADYGRHRGFLGVGGEGDIRPLDRVVLALNRSVANGSGIDPAVRDAVHELRRVALLDYGIVLEIQHLAIRTDQVHRAEVRLLRPPLEGLGAYEVTITYDPSVASVENVTARAFSRNVTWSKDGGSVTFGGEADRFVQGAIVAHLHLLGVGEPEETTGLNVTAGSFTTTEGHPAEVFFVRDGQATVARIATGGDGGGPDGSGSPVPGLGAVLAALAVVVAGIGRRS